MHPVPDHATCSPDEWQALRDAAHAQAPALRSAAIHAFSSHLLQIVVRLSRWRWSKKVSERHEIRPRPAPG
jgi:hypothetical protein